MKILLELGIIAIIQDANNGTALKKQDFLRPIRSIIRPTMNDPTGMHRDRILAFIEQNLKCILITIIYTKYTQLHIIMNNY